MTATEPTPPTHGELLVDQLMGAFPRHDWNDSAIDIYARCLEPLNPELSSFAVGRAIVTLDLAPTVRWLLDTARAEGVRLGSLQAPADADEPVAANPAVVSRIRQTYMEAFDAIDRRVPKSSRGDGGHWHGGPDPCPVCGGKIPAWMSPVRP